jgi:hypothetical protein
LSYETPQGPTVVRSRSVVLTVPAYVAAGLVQKVAVSAGLGTEGCMGGAKPDLKLGLRRMALARPGLAH